MSVNSATESFTNDAELFDQEKYQTTVTTSLDPDPTQIEQAFKNPLSQRIIPIHSHNESAFGEWRLDDVLVRAPSEAFRKHQKEQWGAVKKEAEEKSWWWTVTAIGTGALAAAGGVLYAMDQQYGPILLVAGAIAALVSVVIAANANSSFNQAQTQISKWDADPVMKVGLARNEAHNLGFPYIYANQLKLDEGKSSKTALFHPLQVEYEYKKYFTSFCKKLLEPSNPSPADWMNQFRSSNPVSSALMVYGLGSVPEHMKPVVEDFRQLQSRLDDIATTYDQLKSAARKTANEHIEIYKKTKNELLQPLAKVRDHGIATAEADKNRVLNDPSASENRRQEARKTFNAIKEVLEANYTRSSRPINKKYDGKIQEVEKERDTQLSKLNEQKSSQLSNNFRAAHELLVRAKEAWDNKGYKPVNFQQYFPYQTPVWTQQQPVFVQQQPVYQQPVTYSQLPPNQLPPLNPNIYTPVLPGSNGFGQVVYGQQGQISAPQVFYPKPSAPDLGG